MGKQIEIFTDTRLYGEEIIHRVKELACPKCSIDVMDMNDGKTADQEMKMNHYGIVMLPAIVMDGKVISPEKLAKGKLAGFVKHLLHKQ